MDLTMRQFEEIEMLTDGFPAKIRCRCARREGQVAAGTLLFLTPKMVYAQYITANEEGLRLSALDALFEQAGQALNHGLYTFKTEFGGGVTVDATYELDLKL